MLTQLH